MSTHEARSRTLRYFSQTLVLVVAGTSLLTVGVPRVYAAPLCVNPGGTGGCYSTIQAAVTAAAPGNPITVAAGTYYEHDITVGKSLTITGAGVGNTIVDGGGLGRVFYLPGTTNSVSISGFTIQNGVNDGGPGGGIQNNGTLTVSSSSIYSNTATNGAGIANNRTLDLSNTSVVSNTATAYGGGGILNGSGDARMTLVNVSISHNRTLGDTGGSARIGGGISMYNGSQATLRFVTISSNGAGSTVYETTNSGGGIYADIGTVLTIDQSAIISNTVAASPGAGIYNAGSATLTNVTISGNTGNVVNGGGIANLPGGTIILLNSTVVSNTLTGFSNGGGINNSGTAQIKNTIISNNNAVTSGQNCYGPVTSLGYNLENENSCGLTGTGDLPNANPRIALLGNFGGPAPSHALLVGSPAIDGGTNSGCPSVDQRGVRRPLGARCDIGAYEAAMEYLPLLRK